MLPLAAIGYFVASSVVFAMLWAAIRYASADVSTPLLVFYRNLVGVATFLPLLIEVGPGFFRTRKFRFHGLRALFGLAGTYSTFFAITRVPLADLVAISYGAPVFTTLGALLLLGERLRTRRISALVIGFIGIMIVLRPGAGSLNIGYWAALLSMLMIAANMVTIKYLTGTEDPRQVVAYTFLLMLPVSFIVALPYWQWLDWRQLGLVALVGGLASLGQNLLARAFHRGEASALMPFDFLRLVVATLLGFALFGERIDGYTLLGAVIVLGATIYLAHREAQLRRAR